MNKKGFSPNKSSVFIYPHGGAQDAGLPASNICHQTTMTVKVPFAPFKRAFEVLPRSSFLRISQQLNGFVNGRNEHARREERDQSFTLNGSLLEYDFGELVYKVKKQGSLFNIINLELYLSRLYSPDNSDDPNTPNGGASCGLLFPKRSSVNAVSVNYAQNYGLSRSVRFRSAVDSKYILETKKNDRLSFDCIKLVYLIIFFIQQKLKLAAIDPVRFVVKDVDEKIGNRLVSRVNRIGEQLEAKDRISSAIVPSARDFCACVERVSRSRTDLLRELIKTASRVLSGYRSLFDRSISALEVFIPASVIMSVQTFFQESEGSSQNKHEVAPLALTFQEERC